MEYRILGPLEVLDDGRPVAVGGSKPRALLALLLLHAGTVVPRGRLIDGLWGEAPPETAQTALQVHVSQLRKVVGRGPIVTRSPWNPMPGSKPEGQLEVVVKSVDAEVSTLFSKTGYAAAHAGYVMWPKTCTIFGMAVPIRESAELARQVRDRYVSDGFWRLERHSEPTPSF